MKETRFKGVASSLLISLAFLMIAGFLALHHWTTTNIENLINSGAIYGSSSNEDVVVQIDYIYPEVIGESDQGDLLYLVGYISPSGYLGYVGLEAKENDKEIQELLNTSEEELAQNPQYLVVKSKTTTSSDSISNYQSYLAEVIPPDSEVGKDLTYSAYLSRLNLGLGTSVLVLVPILILLTGLFLFYAWKRLKMNQQAYAHLYEEYPNLLGNLEQLKTDASYLDENLGILIYRNHIFGYKQQIFFLDLREIIWIYHSITSHKRYGFTVNRTSALAIKKQNTDAFKEYAIKNVGKDTDLQLQPLFTYIQLHYPHIIIGY